MAEEKINQHIVDMAAAEFVADALKHFKDQRKNAGLEQEWQLAEMSYYNKTQDLYRGNQSIRWPMLHGMVEDVVPKFDNAIFPPDGKWFDSIPDDIDDEVMKQHGEEAVALLMDQFRDINVRGKMIGVNRLNAIYGTVWVKSYWEHIVKKKYKRDRNNNRVEDYDVEFDNPNFYAPAIWDVYADIKDEDLEGIVIERINKDYQDLWDNRERMVDGEMEGIYRNVTKVREWENPKVTDSTQQRSERIQGLNNHEFGTHEHKIQTFECWGQIPKWFLTKSVEDKKNKLTVNGMIVVAMQGSKEEGKVVLRISDNPFDHQRIAYDRARYVSIPGRLYGLSMLTVNISMEAYANTLLNQDVVNRTSNLRPKWIMDRSARIDPNALRDESQQIIETDLIAGLQPLRPEDFTGSTLTMLGFVQSSVTKGTGASNLIGGTPGGNSLERTASGIATVFQSGLDRFELVVTTLEFELLRPLIYKFWALNQQFLPTGRNVSGMGRVKPREIASPKINFLGIRGIAEKNLMINQGLNFLQTMTPYVPLGFNPMPLLFEVARSLGFGRLIPEMDARPSEESQLEQTPEGEVILLRQGRKVRVDLDDDHDEFIEAYEQLLTEPEINSRVEFNTREALGKRQLAKALKGNGKVLSELAKSANIGGK